MTSKSFKDEEVIFEQGVYQSTMYEIITGSVGIFANYGTEAECRLATLGPGESFGEMGLVECYPRSATAVALGEETVVEEIDADEFESYYASQPQKVLSIMRQMSERLRETNEKYVEACRTVFEAVEAERAAMRREKSLRSRLSGMLKSLRWYVGSV